MYQADLSQSARKVLPALPTMYDLPSEDKDEPGLPDEFHDFQPWLLRLTFCPPNYPKDRIFVAADLNIYYDLKHPLWHKRPDWFAVVDVDRFYGQRDLRLSYVIWQEKVRPFVVVELLSEGTEDEDLGRSIRAIHEPPTKWQVYEQILAVPYYVVFSRYTNELKVFQNVNQHFEELSLPESRLWIPELQIGLGLWDGEYEGASRLWLRWYDASGNWILTSEEQERQRTKQEQQKARQERKKAKQERQKAEQESQRAEQESQRAEQAETQLEQLQEYLRSLGIDPNHLN
jgi:Uma2 family endonuclease